MLSKFNLNNKLFTRKMNYNNIKFRPALKSENGEVLTDMILITNKQIPL